MPQESLANFHAKLFKGHSWDIKYTYFGYSLNTSLCLIQKYVALLRFEVWRRQGKITKKHSPRGVMSFRDEAEVDLKLIL